MAHYVMCTTYDGSWGHESYYNIQVVLIATSSPTGTPTHTSTPSPTSTLCSNDDPFEPDDTTQNARSIGQTPQEHFFCAYNDKDWVFFPASAGDTCAIYTSELGSHADTFLYLYAPDGSSLLAFNDNRQPGDLSSYISYQFNSIGFYYVLCTSTNGLWGHLADYNLQLVCNPTPIPTATLTPTPGNTSTPTPTTTCYLQRSANIALGWTMLGFTTVPQNITNAQDLAQDMQLQNITLTHIAKWTGSAWQIYQFGLPFNNFVLEEDFGYLVRCTAGGAYQFTVVY